ncbi:MAG: VOC family protein [Aeromicrobium sp.]|nr:VOC family protein [Burkholderiales bacterium]
MFSHVFIGVTDFDRAYRFYAPLFQALGLPQRFYDSAKPWAGWNSGGGARPLFVIGHPFDGQHHHPGNGQLIAFVADTRSRVDAVYAAAIAQGGNCARRHLCRAARPASAEPSQLLNYCGAYFRDLDGNKSCVACHSAE